LEKLEDRHAPAIITVTTSADDNTPNDGSVSLREAIQAINNGTTGVDPDIIAQNPGVFGVNDTINFNISAAGAVQTINVGSTGNGGLPPLIKPMTINGYSEMGASMNTLISGDNAKILIELNGANAGPNADGILVGATGAGSTIEGLAINRFSLNGIELQGGGCTIAGNFVGTNPAGNAAESNQNDGIHISNSNSSTIGGTTPGARNIASGNLFDGIHIVGTMASPATGNVIEGNFVGVNAAGTGSVDIKPTGASAGTPGGNDFSGIEISGGNANTIGGSAAGARNVVGFNAEGIVIDDGGQDNVIQGNFSGVGADGASPAGNNLHGIVLRSDDNLPPPLGPGQANEPAVSGNIIGLNPNTNFSGLGNLVEFNGTGGIAVFGSPLPNNATPIQNSGNSILGNSIFENGRTNSTCVGIDLNTSFVYPKDDGVTPNGSKGHGAASDPNNFENFPILTSVLQVAGGVRITGTFTQAASPNTTFRIEFFTNSPDPLGGIAEGQTFLGATNVTTDANGVASFSVTLNAALPAKPTFTADATNLSPDPSSQAGAANVFNTSEFSPSVTLGQNSNPASFPIGLGDGSNGMATVVNLQANGHTVSSLSPIPGFTGPITRAVGDLNGDGIADTVWAVASRGGPRVRIIAGGSGAVLADFFAFAPSFTGGVNVAVADVNRDGKLDVIVGAGTGGGPEVKVIDGAKLTQIQANGEIATSALLGDFFAYAPVFTGGVSVAAADINGDGHADIITGAGPGGGPHVKVIDGTKLEQTQANGLIQDSALLAGFFAFSPTFSGGVNVAAGDFSGDAIPDIIVGAGAGGGPEVRVLDGTKLTATQADGQIQQSSALADFFAYESAFLGGVRVDAVDVNGDGKLDIVTGAGPGGGPLVKVFRATDLSLVDNFFADAQTFNGGVFV
jgi:CSLREA domain-containing protein